jgi:hypothetical protein
VGDVGVFAVEVDRGVEAADGFECGRLTTKLPPCIMDADAQDVAIDGVGGPRNAGDNSGE